jgi:large subunit ribosomal protein L29
MKSSEIKELSNADLIEKIGDMQEQQGKLLLTHAVSPLENPLVIRANRRTIARLKTALKVRLQEGNGDVKIAPKVQKAAVKEVKVATKEVKEAKAETKKKTTKAAAKVEESADTDAKPDAKVEESAE